MAGHNVGTCRRTSTRSKRWNVLEGGVVRERIAGRPLVICRMRGKVEHVGPVWTPEDVWREIEAEREIEIERNGASN